MSVSNATTLPIARALLPRTSSKTSGFFFCGIMLEPVAIAPSRRTRANSLVEKSTTSPARRPSARTARATPHVQSRAKSRSPTVWSALRVGSQGAKRRATSARSIGSDDPEHAPLPSGISI